jgi:hypothetical protein
MGDIKWLLLQLMKRRSFGLLSSGMKVPGDKL